jgi:hypothetical protein
VFDVNCAGLLILVGCALISPWPCQCANPGGSGLPDASEVMRRVVQRADNTENAREAKYTFEKHATIEELDSSGKPTKTRQETYQVIPIEGARFSRLIKTQGRNLTPEEIEEQNRKESEFRKKTGHKSASSNPDEDWLDVRLVERFDFRVEGREKSQGRSLLILSFHPQKNRGAEKSVEDKVLNRLAGTLWVDEEEAEVASLSVGLTEDLSLGWFGMIGSLNQFNLQISRKRLEDGTWLPQSQTVVMGGRKLFSTLRYRTREDYCDYRLP